ncbi:hypothetical protein [Flammeovirga aprica]|uniref:Uncharacterized protein n=1 Tax=Flammeovirga aprica JL-4 TaxID=694437 RepID=A0A7X9S1Z4_9BACT|nr:hypothetical protein [Flammeovirga aprica]NME72931.1 hypothetical protein [Flammeovirga aprica JL-4]
MYEPITLDNYTEPSFKKWGSKTVFWFAIEKGYFEVLGTVLNDFLSDAASQSLKPTKMNSD